MNNNNPLLARLMLKVMVVALGVAACIVLWVWVPSAHAYDREIVLPVPKHSDQIKTVCQPPNCTPSTDGSRTLHYPIGLLDCLHKMEQAMKALDPFIDPPETGTSQTMTDILNGVALWKTAKRDCWSKP